MDRTTLAPIASHILAAALRYVVNDGHVAFAQVAHLRPDDAASCCTLVG